VCVSFDKAKFAWFFDADDAEVHWREAEDMAQVVVSLCEELIEICRQTLCDNPQTPRLQQVCLLWVISGARNEVQCWREQMSPDSTAEFSKALASGSGAGVVSTVPSVRSSLAAVTIEKEGAAKDAQKIAEGFGPCSLSSVGGVTSVSMQTSCALTLTLENCALLMLSYHVRARSGRS